jgi:hypothetical protein
MRAALRAVSVLLLLTTPARPARVVDVADVPSHVGSTVTVEGDVAAARLEPLGLVIELAPGGPKSFRAVLVLALISSLPRSPERIYEGKRVRITGLIQRFQGRPEMILESASSIEVVDVAGAPATVTTTTLPEHGRSAAPPATTEPPPATPPTPARAPESTRRPAPEEIPDTRSSTRVTPPGPTAPPAADVPAPTATTFPPVAPAEPPAPEPAPRPLLGERLAIEACERARARWREVAAQTRAAAATLTTCLDAETFACRDHAAKLAPAIADLEWAEQQVRDRCE